MCSPHGQYHLTWLPLPGLSVQLCFLRARSTVLYLIERVIDGILPAWIGDVKYCFIVPILLAKHGGQDLADSRAQRSESVGSTSAFQAFSCGKAVCAFSCRGRASMRAGGRSVPGGSCRRGEHLGRAVCHPGARHQPARAASFRRSVPGPGIQQKQREGILPARHFQCAATTPMAPLRQGWPRVEGSCGRDLHLTRSRTTRPRAGLTSVARRGASDAAVASRALTRSVE